MGSNEFSQQHCPKNGKGWVVATARETTQKLARQKLAGCSGPKVRCVRLPDYNEAKKSRKAEKHK